MTASYGCGASRPKPGKYKDMLTVRMKKSRVLLLSQSPICCELARHLALSGSNLTMADTCATKQLVSATDFESNFLVTGADAGKPLGEVVVSKLREMNPYAQIDFEHMP